MANEAVAILREAYETLVMAGKKQLAGMIDLADAIAKLVPRNDDDVARFAEYITRCAELERRLRLMLDDTRKRGARALVGHLGEGELVESLFISDVETNEYIWQCVANPKAFENLPDIMNGESSIPKPLVMGDELFETKPTVGKS
jgi:hypothetical protein